MRVANPVGGKVQGRIPEQGELVPARLPVVRIVDQQDLWLTFNVPGVWSSFAKELQAHNGHLKAITQVTIDMSPVYIQGVKDNFGNGAIVFDKFHIVQAFLGFSTRWILLA